jgi:hypothetical protein
MVRLTIGLWDKHEELRISIHRNVEDGDVLGAATEALGDILPTFRRPGDKKLKAKVGQGSPNLYLRRPRSSGKVR